jgi:hypothetical protein
MGLSVLEQLQQLKCMTVRFGAIHDAQQIQLRNYPMLVSGVKSATTEVDVAAKTVRYLIEHGVDGSDESVLEMRNVARYVQTIVWDDAVVLFSCKGEIIYDSRNDEELRKPIRDDAADER